MRTAALTIIAKNYLPFARTLMKSLRRSNPELIRFVVLVDRVDGYFDPAQEDFEVVLSEELGLPDSKWFHFKYSVIELSTAVKPYALEYLLRRYSLAKIIYFDPDIYVYGPLSSLCRLLDEHQIVLVPHLTGQLDEDMRPSELDILRAGIYNLGFIALAAGPETCQLLGWWKRKLLNHCIVDLPRGLFVDQRWMDLVPGLFSSVFINRQPGYDVAYWNLNHRRITRGPGEWLVNGEPLYFYHFSGLDPLNPEPLSKHQNRYRSSDLREALELLQAYCQEVIRSGYSECRQWPYAYGTFENGVSIPDATRPSHLECPELLSRLENPFSDEGFRILQQLWDEPVDGVRPVVSRLAYRIYRSRADLQAAMPDVLGTDRLAFLKWFMSSGSLEDPLHVKYTAPDGDPVNQPPETEAARSPAGARRPAVTVPLSKLAAAIYDSRPDLQVFFPDPCGRHALGFMLWLLTSGRQQYGLQDIHLRPIIEQRDRLLGLYGFRAKSWWRVASAAAAAAPTLRRIIGAGAALTGSRGRAQTGYNQAGTVRPFGINVVGYLHAEIGTGESARRALQSAVSAGLPVSQKNIELGDHCSERDLSAGPESADWPYFANLLHINADRTQDIARKLGPGFFSGRYNIGYWAWELEKFPSLWLDSSALYDEIWAPSTFVQDAISRSSPVPVIRISHAVEAETIQGVGRSDFGLPPDRFVFLVIFDALSVFRRKNPEGAIQAFKAAFGNSDRIQLVVKVNNGQRRPAEMNELRAQAAGLPVSIIDSCLSRREMTALINASDCVVSLHRSEGFGLVLAEAMAAGKPVIATAYSGNLDFTRPDNSFLVSYTLVRVGQGAEPYDSDALWAEPSIADASRQMQFVVNSEELRMTRAAAGRAFVREHLSPRSIGRLMFNRLELIRKRLERSQAVRPSLF
jgi:glycosyltransferase involved in cell wall biosynthesis